MILSLELEAENAKCWQNSEFLQLARGRAERSLFTDLHVSVEGFCADFALI